MKTAVKRRRRGARTLIAAQPRKTDYRIIYEVHDRELRILVITIGHSREVYR